MKTYIVAKTTAAALSEYFKALAEIQPLRGRPDALADAVRLTRRLSEPAAKVGAYCLAAPDALATAGLTYYTRHAGAIRSALAEGGADAETIDAVLYDYGAALCGLYDFTATPQQMKTALDSCAPAVAFDIDRIGFYIGLLYCYRRILDALATYTREVKQQPDTAKRKLYFVDEVSAGEFSDLHAAALLWLHNNGYMTASDFADVDTPAMQNFLNFISLYGNNGHFAQYAYTARNALDATPEQLAEIAPPPLFAQSRENPIHAALQYADIIGDEIGLYLERVAEQVERSRPQPGAEPQTPPADATGAESVGTPERITYPRQYAQILSRGIMAASSEKEQPLPISFFSRDFVRHNPAYADIGTFPIMKAIEVINSLRQLPGAKFDGDRYTIQTNISEIANLYYGFDASQSKKIELLTALFVLSDLFVVTWRKDGRHLVKLLTVRDIGLDSPARGNLLIDVYNEPLQGHQIFISAAEYDDIKKWIKGESYARFVFQILNSGNKLEDSLMNEIFGYDTKQMEAQNSGVPGRLETVQVLIKSHRSRDRAKLKRFFDDWAKKGRISYTFHKNRKGQGVYSWKWQRPLTAEERAEIAAVRERYGTKNKLQ